jgi:FkbM family methyltransferase
MIEKLKSGISAALLRCGLDVRRTSQVPFGLHWFRDIQFFPNGAGLETVFDVGANIGQTAGTIVRHFPRSRVYSFEPVPSTFQELVRQTTKHPNVEPLCRALGEIRGLVPMTVVPLSGSNTLLAAGLDANGKPRVQVQVDTVESFCRERAIHHISLLKIDTEGYEMKVLQGAKDLLANGRVDFVLAECDFLRRNEEPHGDFVEIFSYLSAFGFQVVSFYTGGVDDLGWVWGDALFRQVRGCNPGRVSGSPFRRKQAAVRTL